MSSSIYASSVIEKRKVKSVSYAKWGYIFLLPFLITYAVFFIYPLFSTIRYSFFKCIADAGTFGQAIKEEFIGFDNYVELFKNGFDSNIIRCFNNTLIMWVLGFIPQLVFSLLLAKWFTDLRLNLKATGFFKVVIYMPNIIMAAAMGVIFWLMFGRGGLFYVITGSDICLLEGVWGTRGIVAFINFFMWYGNTTIILMAAIMGVDLSLYESAQIDGASSSKIFFKITLPLIRPILLFVIITSLIGGLQMFDVPNTMTKGAGTPNRSSLTVVMDLSKRLSGDKDFGTSGAISVVLFVVTAILSFIIFKLSKDPLNNKGGK